jgi:hypothetical protein
MDRMVPEPRTFKELVEADLRRAARLIIKVQDEVDPQFRIATPEGDYAIAVTLSRDPRERMMMLRRVSAFMAWKKAMGFILASELQVPDCVYALGVMRQEVHACLARIMRTPKPWTSGRLVRRRSRCGRGGRHDCRGGVMVVIYFPHGRKSATNRRLDADTQST